MALRRLISGLLIAALGASLAAQTAKPIPETELKSKPVPDKTPPMPFPPETTSPVRVHTVEFRAADKMTEKDKLVEADGESAIQERTTWSGMDFNGGAWSYQQVMCTAMPGHLFLQFERNNGVGDQSVFSAAVPRGGEGRVRIVPIQRRGGYSLFSPAPINALTISAFNHVRGEETPAQPPAWLPTGLCYAALAGAHPDVALAPEHAGDERFPMASAPILEIPEKGGAVFHFTDEAAPRRPMAWTMEFNPKGKLVKSGHTVAPLITARAVAPNQVNLAGNAIPANDAATKPEPIAALALQPPVAAPPVVLNPTPIPPNGIEQTPPPPAQ